MRLTYSTKDKVIDGYDATASGDTWTGSLGWTMEVRKARADGRYTLRITTQRDYKSGMRWSYGGTVTAGTSAAALVIARGIAAAAGHPVMVRGEETLDLAADVTTAATRNFVKLDFSYEFEGPSDGFISGEISTDQSRSLAGEWTRTISGYLIAATTEVAEQRLTMLVAPYDHKLQVTRRWSETYVDATGADESPKRMAPRLDFSCTIRDTRLQATAEYTDSTENDYPAMRQTREISGTLWTDTKEHAEAAALPFITLLLGTRVSGYNYDGSPIMAPVLPQRLRLAHTELQWATGSTGTVARGVAGGVNQWVKLDFSCTATRSIVGATGYDLLEASYTMERVGSINTTVVTPIPFGRPIFQADTGWLPGKIGIQATAKAVNKNTAKLWVQGKLALAPAGTKYETEQPRETESPEYTPFSGTEVLLWNFTGSYGWTYATLDGTW